MRNRRIRNQNDRMGKKVPFLVRRWNMLEKLWGWFYGRKISRKRGIKFFPGIKEETFSTKSELEFINCTYSKSIFFGKNKDFFQESGKILYMFLFIFTCSV